MKTLAKEVVDRINGLVGLMQHLNTSVNVYQHKKSSLAFFYTIRLKTYQKWKLISLSKRSWRMLTGLGEIVLNTKSFDAPDNKGSKKESCIKVNSNIQTTKWGCESKLKPHKSLLKSVMN